MDGSSMSLPAERVGRVQEISVYKAINPRNVMQVFFRIAVRSTASALRSCSNIVVTSVIHSTCCAGPTKELPSQVENRGIRSFEAIKAQMHCRIATL
jgi:hypothetical protein